MLKTATAIGALALAFSTSAYAADVYSGGSTKDAPSFIEAPRSVGWAGPYIGIHAGYAWGEADHAETNGGMFGKDTYDVEGAFGGVTAGYNIQFRNIVVGVEGDVGYMDLNGSGVVPSSSPEHHQDLAVDAGFYGVIAGRLGIAIDRTLIYGKAGFVYFDGEATQATTKKGWETEGTDAFRGFAYGGGVEHKIDSNWSLKFEYLHFDFGKERGNQQFTADKPDAFVFSNETDLTVDTVKAGLNYRF